MNECLHKSIVIPLEPQETKTTPVTKVPKKEKKKDGNKDRAIQTLFKTLSQNNYRLQEMIDRKANIIISVNAIILSILLGTAFVQEVFMALSNIHLLILVTTSTLSIFGALIAIKPFLVTGSSKEWKGSMLLNFDTAHRLDLDEYKSLVKATIKKDKSIYNSMIEDVYFISQNVAKKHKFLSFSVGIFLTGLAMSTILMIVGTF